MSAVKKPTVLSDEILTRQLKEFNLALLEYKEQRLAEVPKSFLGNLLHYKTTFFGFNCGYSAKEKISAVDQLIRSLNGLKVEFSERQLEALNNSRLGVIVAKYKHLLPSDYKRQENVRIIRGMNILGRR